MPPSDYRSEDRMHVLRVKGKMGNKPVLTLERKTAEGFLPLWTAPSPQEAHPVEVFIAGDGKSVVLRDEWHGVGRGIVLAFLGPEGRTLRTYELKDLLGEKERYSARMTTSSLWWSSGALFFLRNAQAQFGFITKPGTLRLFDTRTGLRIKPSKATIEEIRREQIKLVRPRLEQDSADLRCLAATHLSILGDRDSVLSLMRLLDDPAEGLVGISGLGQVPDGDYKTLPVQLAAGEALVRLLGKAALPRIRKKLPGANPYMKYHWKYLLDTTGKPKRFGEQAPSGFSLPYR